MVEMAAMAYQARLARMERMAGMVQTERLERRGSLASKAHLDFLVPKAHLELLAPAVEGWFTLAGDKQPAPTHQEQSSSMQEGLEELIIPHKEEQPTSSACQRTQTIYSTGLECRATDQSVGLSMRQVEVLV